MRKMIEKSYFLDKEKDDNGEHIIHVSSCKRLPHAGRRIFLGDLENPFEAAEIAGKLYPKVVLCKICTESYYDIIRRAFAKKAYC